MKENHKVPFGALGVVLAIGIVFGDIGTSPLYVMRAILNALPAGQLTRPEYILGAVSCVIWTLTIQTTLKYVIITLRADNKGEGGILSLYALIRQKYRWAYILAGIGAATLLADGIITPAMTVMSAIEGLNTIAPHIPVIPVTILIVLVLFLVQPFGTGSLGKYFGPLMIIWFTMMAVMGLSQIITDFSVFRAFNPMYAINFLIEVPQTMIMLGAIFLCTTGAEALYSDLGHCGLKNIRISWIYVKSALILNYLGQAAWIINSHHVTPDVNPFFAMMPTWFTFVGVIMATLAAIIASQALISGSFTVISEAISLNIWPNVKIQYTSDIKGQLYIPSINYMMMVLCIIIILTMRSSMKLEAAYGLAITLSMLMTSVLLFLYFVKNNKPLWYSMPLTLFFVVIEFSFFIANMQKFAHGGFVPVIIAGFLVFLMYSWYNGRRIKRHYTVYDPVDEKYINQIVKISEDTTIPKAATHLVYIVKANNRNFLESKIAYSLFKRTPKRADTYWFVRIKRTDEPYEFSYETTVYAPKKIFRINIRAGFKLGIHTDKYVNLIANELERHGLVDLSSRYPSMQDVIDKRGDFKFMIVDRIFRNVHMDPWRQITLGCYNIVKKLTTSDTQMYDIDPSLAVIETVPLRQADHTEEQLRELLLQSDETLSDTQSVE
ncbi:KUP system potassium uptake protein [Dysgonomonas hofstadii]|uniref:Probable potassium transport system protein Kup n=1 Tax=Dysgonomonas hofstadii TaxID=637886 RepID=A0A840CS38_9BACT|nr:KUP/HAK/KT family potassium transporter [Dysgonomonas hofstadii]MBB4036454.1 KUP system potassium uptake protein [Dysgonomonas hofstadii]